MDIYSQESAKSFSYSSSWYASEPTHANSVLAKLELFGDIVVPWNLYGFICLHSHGNCRFLNYLSERLSIHLDCLD